MGMGSAATAASEAGEPWHNGIDCDVLESD
jgi:hypothetical protein